jgi:hypothetical protein
MSAAMGRRFRRPISTSLGSPICVGVPNLFRDARAPWTDKFRGWDDDYAVAPNLSFIGVAYSESNGQNRSLFRRLP